MTVMLTAGQKGGTMLQCSKAGEAGPHGDW
jgi:hypothetical protein